MSKKFSYNLVKSKWWNHFYFSEKEYGLYTLLLLAVAEGYIERIFI